MQLQQADKLSQQRIHRWMDMALFGAIAMGLILIVNQFVNERGEQGISSVHTVVHTMLLFFLLMLLVLRWVYQVDQTKVRNNATHQADALAALLSTAKHELNNDMQVIVGNAELAGILMNSGGSVEKPISHISKAASAAIVRIEQLLVFNSSKNTAATAVDLNAIFRQSAALFMEELPDSTLRLELDRLPSRVLMNPNLFTLCLQNFIKRGPQYLVGRCEIVFRTAYTPESKTGNCSVRADVILLSQNGRLDEFMDSTVATLHIPIQELLVDSSALWAMGGAVSIRHECSDYGAQISMHFHCDNIPVTINEPAGIVCKELS